MIALTGGGTGGHLAVVKAVNEELKALDKESIFVGSTAGQDRAWFENDPNFARCYFLDSFGVMNRRGIYKLLSLINILKLTFKTVEIFKKEGVTAVLSVGGYSAAPAVFAAIITRKKLFIHEQNATMGTLNKIAKPFAKQLFSSFTIRSSCKDYPVSKQFFDNKRIRSSVKTVIFLGGSQGATAINNLAMKLAPLLKQKEIYIIHQSGKNDLAELKKFYSSNLIQVDLFDFDKNIIDRIKSADLAICRAGAGTLFELTANGLPAIFVPYPYAAKNHQVANAKFLVDRGCGWMMQESEISLDFVASKLESDLEEISTKLTELIAPNGARCIAEAITR